MVVPSRAMSRAELSRGKHFFNGSRSPKYFKHQLPDDSKVHLVREKFWIHNSTDGIQGRRSDPKKTLLFRLLPRKEALSRTQPSCKEEYDMVIRLHEASKKGTTIRDQSSVKRSALHECDAKDKMYVCPGVKVNQGRKGCISERPTKIDADDWNLLVRMIQSMESLTRPYIESQNLKGLSRANNVARWKVVSREREQDEECNEDDLHPHIWQQAAFGRNIALNSHTDDDFFLSCMTVLWSRKDYPLKDCPVVQYFVFPEDGIAVALRPGDVLLFNPRVAHCSSSRCHFEDDIVLGSFYLKSSLVGGNNNDIPFDAFASLKETPKNNLVNQHSRKRKC